MSARTRRPARGPGRPWLVPVALAILSLLPSLASAVERRGQAAPAKVAGTGLVFDVETVPDSLIDCLLGAALSTRNAVLTGAAGSARKFTGGTGILGFEAGVAIGSGLVVDATGPNAGTQTGTDHSLPGDSDLDALVTPDETYDAAVLEFEFFTAEPRTLQFDYVFSSEEYSEFVGAGFDDVVAFFLNGTAALDNIARVPAGCGGTAGIPVSVDNVNCGNFSDPQTPSSNCGCYIANEVDIFPPPATTLDTEMDGLTQVFTATGTTVAGWNSLKIAVADAGDGILDSNVFIRCQSLVVPVRRGTWGEIKARYR